MSSADGAVRSVIGVCAVLEQAQWGFWNQEAAVVAASYLRSVRLAGGLPIVLAPEDLDRSDVAQLTERMDGLLLVGGMDLDPASYGAGASEWIEATSSLRDTFELQLTRSAFEEDIPVFGVCRGLQILNVATGGTLYGHLLDAGFAEHRPAPGYLDDRTFHRVKIEPDTLLARSTRAVSLTVNSHHHQGIDRVGAGGVVTARSLLDGLVEAVEWPAQTYALGVQWHPEAIEDDATMAGFIAAASERSKRNAPKEGKRWAR